MSTEKKKEKKSPRKHVNNVGKRLDQVEKRIGQLAPLVATVLENLLLLKEKADNFNDKLFRDPKNFSDLPSIFKKSYQNSELCDYLNDFNLPESNFDLDKLDDDQAVGLLSQISKHLEQIFQDYSDMKFQDIQSKFFELKPKRLTATGEEVENLEKSVKNIDEENVKNILDKCQKLINIYKIFDNSWNSLMQEKSILNKINFEPNSDFIESNSNEISLDLKLTMEELEAEFSARTEQLNKVQLELVTEKKSHEKQVELFKFQILALEAKQHDLEKNSQEQAQSIHNFQKKNEEISNDFLIKSEAFNEERSNLLLKISDLEKKQEQLHQDYKILIEKRNEIQQAEKKNKRELRKRDSELRLNQFNEQIKSLEENKNKIKEDNKKLLEQQEEALKHDFNEQIKSVKEKFEKQTETLQFLLKEKEELRLQNKSLQEKVAKKNEEEEKKSKIDEELKELREENKYLEGLSKDLKEQVKVVEANKNVLLEAQKKKEELEKRELLDKISILENIQKEQEAKLVSLNTKDHSSEESEQIKSELSTVKETVENLKNEISQKEQEESGFEKQKENMLNVLEAFYKKTQPLLNKKDNNEFFVLDHLFEEKRNLDEEINKKTRELSGFENLRDGVWGDIQKSSLIDAVNKGMEEYETAITEGLKEIKAEELRLDKDDLNDEDRKKLQDIKESKGLLEGHAFSYKALKEFQTKIQGIESNTQVRVLGEKIFKLEKEKNTLKDNRDVKTKEIEDLFSSLQEKDIGNLGDDKSKDQKQGLSITNEFVTVKERASEALKNYPSFLKNFEELYKKLKENQQSNGTVREIFIKINRALPEDQQQKEPLTEQFESVDFLVEFQGEIWQKCDEEKKALELCSNEPDVEVNEEYLDDLKDKLSDFFLSLKLYEALSEILDDVFKTVLTEEIKKLESAIAQKEEGYKSTEGQLQKELEKLKTQLVEKENENSQRILEQSLLNEDLQKTLTEKQNVLNNLVEEKVKLIDQLTQQKQLHQNGIDDLNRNIQTLRSELETKTSDLTELNNQFSGIAKTLEQKNQENLDLSVQKKSLDEKLVGFEKQLGEKTEALDLIKQQLSEIRLENNNLKDQLENIKKETENQKNHLEISVEKENKLTVENEALKRDQVDLQKELGILIQQDRINQEKLVKLDQLTIQKQDVDKTVLELSEALKGKESEVSELTGKLSQVESANQNLSKKQDDLETTNFEIIEKLNQEIQKNLELDKLFKQQIETQESLKQNLNTQSEQFSQVNLENEKLTISLQEKTNELEKLGQSNIQQENGHKATIEALNKLNVSLGDQYKKSQEKIEELNKKIVLQESEFNGLKNQLLKKEETVSTLNTHLQTQQLESNKKIESLEEKVRTQEEWLKDSSNDKEMIIKLDEENKALNEALKAKELDISSLTNMLSQEKSQNQNLINNQKDLDKKLLETDEALKAQREISENLTLSLEVQVDKNRSLIAAQSTLEDKVKNSGSENEGLKNELSNLQDSYTKINETLKDKTTELSNLSKSVEQVQFELAGKTKGIEDLNVQLLENKNTIQILTDKNELLITEQSELNKKLTQAGSKQESLKGQLQQKVSELNSFMMNTGEAQKKVMQDLEEGDKQIQALNTENSDLKNQITNFGSTILNLKNELSQVKLDLEKEQMELQKKEKTLLQLEEKNKTDITSLNQERKDFEFQIQSQQKAFTELNQQLESLTSSKQDEFSKLTAEMEALRAQVSESETKQSHTLNLQSQLQTDLKLKEEALSQLKETHEKTVSDLMSQLKVVEEGMNLKSQLVTDKEQSILEFKKSQENFIEAQKKLENELKEKNQSLEVQETEKNTLLGKLNGKKLEIDNLNNALKERDQALILSKEQINELNGKMQIQTIENGELKNQLSQKNLESEKVIHLNEEITKSKEIIEALETQNQSDQISIEKLTDENKQLKQDIGVQKQRNTQQSKNSENHKKEFEEKEQNLNREISQKEKVISLLKENGSRLEENIKEQSEKISQQLREISDQKALISSIHQKNKQLTEVQQSLEEQFGQIQENHQKENDKKEDEIKVLKSKLLEKDHKLEALETQVGNLDEEQLKSKKDSLKNSKEQQEIGENLGTTLKIVNELKKTEKDESKKEQPHSSGQNSKLIITVEDGENIVESEDSNNGLDLKDGEEQNRSKNHSKLSSDQDNPTKSQPSYGQRQQLFGPNAKTSNETSKLILNVGDKKVKGEIATPNVQKAIDIYRGQKNAGFEPKVSQFKTYTVLTFKNIKQAEKFLKDLAQQNILSGDIFSDMQEQIKAVSKNRRSGSNVTSTHTSPQPNLLNQPWCEEISSSSDEEEENDYKKVSNYKS